MNKNRKNSGCRFKTECENIGLPKKQLIDIDVYIELDGHPDL